MEGGQYFVLFKEGNNLKIVICISNYVNTIDVLIDGHKIDIKKLSLFSKAEYEHYLKMGVHEVAVVKRSDIMGHGWKKIVLFDWISCLLGVPDFTLAEKTLDKKTCSVFLKVKVERDIHINFKLTEAGFEIIEPVNDIFDVFKQTEISKTANKRIKYAYIIPAITLAIIIECCMLIVGIFLVINIRYTSSIIVFISAAFWAWLVCNMLLKRKR